MQIQLSSKTTSATHKNLKEEFLKEIENGLHPFINSAIDKDLINRLSIPKRNFKKIIILGIGGSSLGGIAIMRALYRPLKHMEADSTHFFFLDQIDPDLIFHLSQNISLKDTHFIAISKSGNTIETVSLFKFFHQKIIDAKLDPKEHFTIITAEKDSFLGKTGLPIVTMPKNLSGRFSVLSEVGLLPAKMANIDIEKIQKGALDAWEHFKHEPAEKNIPLMLAENQFREYNSGKKITVVFPYSYRLNRFADWYIQLMAESLGKTPEIGPTPIRAIGPTDQHSQLQLFMDGPKNKQVLFLEVTRHHHAPQIPGEKYTLEDLMNAEKKGTQEALEKALIPTQTLIIPKITEETIGELIMTLELQIALLGKMHGVNTYNQLGVEMGKKITREILK
ncbi:MAG: hypothetical protein ACD_51C00337G0001 [uncultured bacterium]|nr:MAG: hypothetical protein ACD_51C00337G0001 [uncultured bacterium]OGJ47374.1 MAG: hypothetical protein A2244_02695 [Candidatus Peregrinibacteria bacterium RIFOXYA2_FULL_41_18]OGJ52532.1 MAG: hypothetical protein A2448_00030 [Candidatus Peregrinibacteria bacterium RIFOXYC2_FULL_41_22]